jgi:hypothetical protein
MIRLVFLAIVLLGVHASALADAPVKAKIVFSGLWWTRQQVPGMDPDHPPPKETRATITNWDGSDPEWPPHPDIVDVDVTLTGPASAAKIPVTISYQWLERRHSTRPSILVQDTADLSSRSSRPLHATVNVSEYLDQEHFPDRLRIIVKIGAHPAIVKDLRFVLPA